MYPLPRSDRSRCTRSPEGITTSRTNSSSVENAVLSFDLVYDFHSTEVVGSLATCLPSQRSRCYWARAINTDWLKAIHDVGGVGGPRVISLAGCFSHAGVT